MPYFSSSIQSNLINFYSSGSIYTSRGVFLRLIPLLFGALLFLCFKSRFGLNRVQSNILTATSFLSFVLLLLVFISPASSTIADRLSAYLLPLLLLPVPLLSKFIAFKPLISPIFIDLLLVFSSWLLLITWLSSSRYAYAWLPYQNILF